MKKHLDPPSEHLSRRGLVSPDCRFVAWSLNASADAATAAILIKEVGSESIVATFRQQTSGVLVQAFSQDGRKLAVVVFDSSVHEKEWTLQIIDAQTGKILQVIPGIAKFGFSRFRFSPDGSIIVVSTMQSFDSDNEQLVISTWDVQRGKQIAQLQLGTERMLWDLIFSADGRKIIAGFEVANLEPDECQGEIRVWNTRTGREIARWNHEDRSEYSPWGVTALAVSPDGKKLAAGASNGAIHFYSIPE